MRYITVDQSYNDKELLLICKDLKIKFGTFSNIIICLYADNEIGNLLTKNINQNINDIEQADAWLAMYSYNSVEGEYFDDKPLDFLGTN